MISMCITDLNFLRESQGSPQFLFLVNGRDDVPSSSRPIPRHHSRYSGYVHSEPRVAAERRYIGVKDDAWDRACTGLDSRRDSYE